MRALTVVPGRAESARVTEVPEPGDAPVLVEAVALGICGTDREIVAGAYGWPPPGRERFVLGHESLGRVARSDHEALSAGDLVVGIVRRPDPVPCACCARGEWDMCRNGRYTERGIKGLDGYGAERWQIEPEFAVVVDPRLDILGVLVEPASVVAKAWDHVERIATRACVAIERVLVTGAGPIGLLAALLAVQRGLQVHVLDVVRDGPKPDAVRALGATYHTGPMRDTVPRPDVVIECTGVGTVVLDALEHSAIGAIVCLAGVSSGGHPILLDAADLNRRLVLENDVVFGSVNANRRHYEIAAESLRDADAGWLERLITRRVRFDSWPEALERRPDDIKVVIDFAVGG